MSVSLVQGRTFFLTSILLIACQLVWANEDGSIDRKSPSGAVALSLTGTILPCALAMPFVLSNIEESDWNEIVGGTLISTGVLFGPGGGHLYAHNKKAFYRGVAVRGLGTGIFLAGISMVDNIFERDDFAAVLITTGGAVVVISMIGDIARADGSARRFNEEHAKKTVSFYPAIYAGVDGFGVKLRLRF